MGVSYLLIECRSGYKLGKEGVLGAEKRIDDYQFKSCIIGDLRPSIDIEASWAGAFLR
jgi:hypothetical protein